ncbi:MAG: 4-(cytidine 5'-diphospho)-2-C-methyl-D-erythritol kinase [Bryobacteraceae bacterium]
MPRVRVRSLAKINLDLRVLSKRSDGFHDLRTIFQTVSLGDTIEIEFARARTSRIEIDSDIDIPDNLIVKAAAAILSEMKTRARVRFRLEKRIPIGGGLGGGSSNAAAVLLALPALAAKRVPLERLLELASQLGSDVPFFLLGGTAVGLGRGAEVYPLPDAPSKPAVLVCPGVHVSTADAYSRLHRGLTDVIPSPIMNSFQSLAGRVGDRGAGNGWDTVNDFEAVVFRAYPQLESIKGKLLKLGARPALMSGSGSTIFGIFDSRLQRDRALGALENELGSEKIHPVSLVNRRQYRSLWWRQLRTEIEGKVWPPQEWLAK